MKRLVNEDDAYRVKTSLKRSALTKKSSDNSEVNDRPI